MRSLLKGGGRGATPAVEASDEGMAVTKAGQGGKIGARRQVLEGQVGASLAEGSTSTADLIDEGQWRRDPQLPSWNRCGLWPGICGS